MARGLAVLALSLVLALAAGCAPSPGAAPDGGAPSGGGATVERARALAQVGTPLPLRAEALALAQTVEALAIHEGAGARAVELHTLAARIYERAYRTFGEARDGEEAVTLASQAGRELGAPEACDAALFAARLAGEVARDATRTYTELHRVARRLRSHAGKVEGACLPRVERARAAVVAFRPPPDVLAAVDRALEGEGAGPPSAAPGVPVGPRAGLAPRIVAIDFWPGRDASRVVIVLDRQAQFRAGDEAGALGRGPRTFVELDGVDLAAAARDVPSEGIVTRVRAEATTSGSRVSLELGGHGYRRIFYLPEPFRVVIDVARNPPGTAPRGHRAVTRIVLDPGHGGTDPGAIGSGGVREKDVTLDIAHRAAPVLAKQGLQVLLTRDDDRYVTLEERTARANGFGADLFLSIHCNSAENHAHHGVETYVLDTTRDAIANRVAARENEASPGATAELGAILATMRLADQATRSTRLAELIQRAAIASLGAAYGDVTDGGVHTAGFYVLVGARMPSALFETSYISNPTEEQRLGSEDFRQRLADAVVNAITAYREGR